MLRLLPEGVRAMTTFHILQYRLRSAAEAAARAAREGRDTRSLVAEAVSAAEEFNAYVGSLCLGMEE
jgi:hypothetical protein